MPLWQRRRRPQHPQCYFCSTFQEHLHNSASVQRFVCCSCGSYNALSSSGAPLDDERPAVHWDSAIPSNALSFSKRATPSKNSKKSTSEDTSVFCQQCRRHQDLQLYLLGAYYDNTEENSAEDHILQHRLQEYKDSLDSRYPSLCASCAPAVKQELSLRNTRARADILNHLIISNSAKSRGASASSSTARQRKRDPRATAQWKLQILLWRLKGCVWALLQLMSLFTYGFCMFKPTLALKISSQTEKTTLILSLVASTFLISFWQPLWHKHRELAAAAPDYRQVSIPGRTVWLAACLYAFVVRFCCVYTALHYAPKIELVTFQRLSLAALTTTGLGLSGASSRQLVVHHSTRVSQPSSRPSTPGPSHPPTSRPESPAPPPPQAEGTPARPHPLFGDWQAAQRAHQSSSSAVPMDVDEAYAVEVGNAGGERTPLEELLAGTDLRAHGPFAGS